MVCLECGKEFIAKRSTAKFDTNNCKLKYNRRREFESLPDPIEIEGNVQGSDTLTVVDDTLTPTDKLFDDERPGYYNYTSKGIPNPLSERTCLICKKNFTTRTSLRKFCSPDCQTQIWTLIASGGK